MRADDYRALFDANPRPMWLLDRSTGRFVTANRAFCERYGYARDEAIGMSARDLRPPDDIPRFEADFARDAQTSAPAFVRYGKHRTKSGEVFDVEVELATVVLEGVSYTLGQAVDVTRQKDAAQLAKIVFEHSGDGIAITNADGTCRYISPSGERILGLQPGELIGRPSASVADADDMANLKPFAPNEVRIVRNRSRHTDGHTMWLASTTTDLRHDLGVRGWVASFRDITDQVEMEESLRRSEHNFRALIERSPTFTLVHDEGVCAYLNPAAVAALGYTSADEVIGRDLLDFVHPDDRARVRERIVQTELTGTAEPSETRMCRRDGRYITLEAEVLKLTFDGRPAHVMLGRDVSERSAMFARMAMVDRMISVGTLAAGVAHEINNPLSYVVANLAVLARELPALLASASTLPPDEVAKLVGDARDGADRVSAIVRDLRTLSRTDDVEMGAVALPEVMAAAIRITASETRHKARVVETYGPGVPHVRANASRLGQVFVNLLVNAAQAIPEGESAEIRITVQADPERAGAIVEIADTGEGIPPNLVGRIFDPFFTTKPIGLGTGLGLSICHQIVRSFGGDIGVTSVVGSGSTFRVRLLAATGPIAAQALIEVPAPSVGIGVPILMIDDEAGVGRSTQHLLAPEYDVRFVTRAREGLAVLDNRDLRFEAIVCDVMMPEMSGIELFEHLQRTDPHYASRVVFLTGGAFTPSARAFLESTVQPCVDKPFDETDLARAIEVVRARRST